MSRWVCLDVGETLIDETRVWGTWADELGIPRLTFMAALGAAVERVGLPCVVKPSRSGSALGVGFVGVVILASGRVAGENVMGAAIAGAVASLCYGFAINLTRHWLADLPPSAGVAGTLSCATLMAAPFAVATWPATPIPASPAAATSSCRNTCTTWTRGTRCRSRSRRR